MYEHLRAWQQVEALRDWFAKGVKLRDFAIGLREISRPGLFPAIRGTPATPPGEDSRLGLFPESRGTPHSLTQLFKSQVKSRKLSLDVTSSLT